MLMMVTAIDPPRKLLVFFLTLLLCFSLNFSARSEITSFDFSSFSLRNFTLLGDSFLRSGIVGLTRELGVPSSSSGTVIYNRPVPFPAGASFSTRFSFCIDNVNPTSFGDGLTFFLSPENDTLGSPGGYLGLVNSSQLTKNRFVAVEFDTRLDLHFADPNENHVGLDVDSLNSIKTADAMAAGVDLKSGNSVTAWIDYKNTVKEFTVFLSYSSFKPENPILTVAFDLCGFFPDEIMYPGFSASTEGSTETHLISNWAFQTSGARPVKPRTNNPHNVSETTVSPPNSIPVVSDPNPGRKNHKRLGLGLGISGPVFFFAVLVVLGYVSIRRWRGIKTEVGLKAELLTGPRQFSYKELKSSTKGFHPSRILGHGAFGTVYKAFLLNSGMIAAVKRSRHSHEGKTEFLAELSIIACLRHKNLVQLQGWCVEKDELLLVYEFMPYGSLDNVLYQDGEGGASILTWAHRYNIAVGLASVLSYLHQECEQQVIHRDIKASNIMLDANFNARLGDFGLARLMDHDKSPVSTLTAGTMGYLAPEYLQYGKATDKTDVFSYGVVVLEVVCGRRPIESIEMEPDGRKTVNLVDWVWGLHSEGRIAEAVDRRLKDAITEVEEEQVKRLLLVGLSCANPDSEKRPSMRRVLQILNNEAEVVSVPRVKPTLSFSSMPLSIEDIVSSDGEEEDGECHRPGHLFGIRIDH